MWRQPDSALAVMLEFAVSPEADSLNELDGHYCQLLIAELFGLTEGTVQKYRSNIRKRWETIRFRR